MNFQMFKLYLEKAEEPEIKLPTSIGLWKKQESSKKHLYLLYWLWPLTVWIIINCGKFWKRWEYQTTWPASWETYCAGQEATVRTGHGTTNWFQIGKGGKHTLVKKFIIIQITVKVYFLCLLNRVRLIHGPYPLGGVCEKLANINERLWWLCN